MQYGKFQQTIGPHEKSETRERMHDVFAAFEKLERELREHIRQLHLSRTVRDPAAHLERELQQQVEQLRLSQIARDAAADSAIV